MRLSSLIQRIFDSLLSEGISIWVQSWGSVQCADLNLHVSGTSQESDSLWLVFGPPSHLPLPLAHLSHGPPTEPAVEMSEEHLEEKCSVCG